MADATPTTPPNEGSSSGDPGTSPLAEWIASDRQVRPSTPTGGSSAAMAYASVPREIGRYHVKGLIGHGGMGSVYEAIQDQPRRVVALKVMRFGASSRSALRRFAYEAQLLARLRHPGIAQVFEAGTHIDHGVRTPYFAMEYVPGARHLTDYAEQKDLSTRERIELFIKVCDAVHHGHQKGIVHRDLKPQNILVDSIGQPKVIDFGVARATDSDMAVTTQQTDVGSLVGTIQYMSPEQCAADPHDLDTRSDVYSLGVILYQLLCRKLPYDCSNQTIPEAVRIVQDIAPARPSSVSAFVKGDLEQICLKALEKDRDRRYRSAADLADDLRRYLGSEPVTARRAGVVYQAKLFARRNRTVVIATTAVFLALAAGTAVSAVMAARAIRHRLEAEHRGDLMMAAMRAGESEADLVALSVRADAELAGEVPALIGVHSTLAKRHADLGHYAAAANEADRAISLVTSDDPDAARRIRDLSIIKAGSLLAAGNSRAAAETLEPLSQAVPPQELPPDLLNILGAARVRAGDWVGAERALERLNTAQQRRNADASERLHTQHNLSLVLARAGRHSEAKRSFEAAQDLEHAELLAGRDVGSIPRSLITSALWPDRVPVGYATATHLAFVGLTPPVEARIPAYRVAKAQHAVDEFFSGRTEPQFAAAGGTDIGADTRSRLSSAFQNAAGTVATPAELPGAVLKRIASRSDGPALMERLNRLADVLRQVGQLPVGRCARWAAQRAILDRVRPPGFDVEAVDVVVRGENSPDRALRLAWDLLLDHNAWPACDARVDQLLAAASSGMADPGQLSVARGFQLYRRGRFAEAASQLRAASAEQLSRNTDVIGVLSVIDFAGAIKAACEFSLASQLRGKNPERPHLIRAFEEMSSLRTRLGGAILAPSLPPEHEETNPFDLDMRQLRTLALEAQSLETALTK